MYSNIQTVNYAWRYTVLRNTVLPAMIPSMFLTAYIFHFSKLFSTCLLKGARFDKDILDENIMSAQAGNEDKRCTKWSHPTVFIYFIKCLC